MADNELTLLAAQNNVLRQTGAQVVRQNKRLLEIIQLMVDRPEALNAVRFLAEINELDPPNFAQMISAILVIRDNKDVESVRLAAKAMLRNLERLEEKLDEARGELAASINSEEQI
jgi:hypothetical protein